jgi:lipopolysaccharide/colanic/teichoic acid biosynthesis glycosyltransferase
MTNKMHPLAASLLGNQTLTPIEMSPCLDILPQDAFHRMLYIEQKRTERSRSRFVLMLLESAGLLTSTVKKKSFAQILIALSRSTRETDITGWYKEGSIVGIIFTEIGPAEGKAVASALLTKVTAALSSTLSIEQINQIKISFHVFPEDWDELDKDRSSGSVLYPDTNHENGPKKASLVLKRAIDVAGSLFALLVFSPFLVIISMLVKLTSKGPVLFKQERVGQFGHRFCFLKFRSMHTQNDHAVHEEYVKSLITGGADKEQRPGQQKTVFKLTNDPRVTSVGRFLRRTSLDELPQFINVLLGDMSLVGPRPPIPYEVRCYDIWHKRRLLAVKPGITGLWQVTGRSRVGFDDMVRLDLKYAKSWSLWLDIKILLQTPRAVFSGDGAY